MASGLLLWVSCISLLLDGSISFSGEGRISLASKNLLDDDDRNALTHDQGEGSYPPAGLVPPNYSKTLAAMPPNRFPAGQKPGYVQSGNDVEKILNGASRKWESNSFDPITFPLKPGYPVVNQLQQRPTANQPQSPPGPVYTGNLPVSSGSVPVSPNVYETSGYGAQTVNVKPPQSSPSAAVPSSFQYWKPATSLVAGSQFSSQSLPIYSGSSPQGGLTKPATPVSKLPDGSEDPQSLSSNMVELGNPSPVQYAPEQPLLQYPPDNTQMYPFNPAEQYSQGNDIDGSVGYTSPLWQPFETPASQSHKAWMTFPFSNFGDNNLYYGQIDQPQNSVDSRGKYWVPRVSHPQRVNQLPGPRPLRKSFLVRSKSGYQRRRFSHSKTTYTPQYKMPPKYPKNLKAFSGPEQNPVRRRAQKPTVSRKM